MHFISNTNQCDLSRNRCNALKLYFSWPETVAVLACLYIVRVANVTEHNKQFEGKSINYHFIKPLTIIFKLKEVETKQKKKTNKQTNEQNKMHLKHI